MKGRVLKDIKHLDLKAGEYADVPNKEADGLTASGHFDPKAKDPTAVRQKPARDKKE